MRNVSPFGRARVQARSRSPSLSRRGPSCGCTCQRSACPQQTPESLNPRSGVRRECTEVLQMLASVVNSASVGTALFTRLHFSSFRMDRHSAPACCELHMASQHCRTDGIRCLPAQKNEPSPALTQPLSSQQPVCVCEPPVRPSFDSAQCYCSIDRLLPSDPRPALSRLRENSRSELAILGRAGRACCNRVKRDCQNRLIPAH